MKISAMVLVGEYEPHLKYCIESIRDIVDEIIQFEKTKNGRFQIEGLGNKFKYIAQSNEDTDFSLWRNQCLDKATGDWILILDADEILAKPNGDNLTREELEYIINNGGAEFLAFQTYHFLYNYFTLDGRNNGIHYSMRLFKNRPDRRFKRKIHEYLDMDKCNQVGGPLIWHFGHCKGMEDLRSKYKKTGKVSDNPYGTRDDNDSFCATNDLFRGNRPMIHYNGPLPKVMKLW